MKLDEIRHHFTPGAQAKREERARFTARKDQLRADLESFAPPGENLSGLAEFVIAAAQTDADLDRIEVHLPPDVAEKLARLRTERAVKPSEPETVPCGIHGCKCPKPRMAPMCEACLQEYQDDPDAFK